MIRLHGVTMSNYYSIIKMCLLEKGMDFEEVKSPPSQDAAYLNKSPMGKVPCIETEQGFLSETLAIAEYLEAVAPKPALLPTEPFARAKTIELVRALELYVELVARRCLPEAFFGRAVSDETKREVDRDLERGMAAVKRLAKCKPYMMGSDFTLADIYALNTFSLAGGIVQKIYGKDLLADAPDLKKVVALVGERPSAKRMAAERG
jgi:glutathione S-transferase